MIRFFDEAREWCRGRNPWVRLPLLLWFVWIAVHHLRDPEYQSLFKGINLGIHELGHVVFTPLGEMMHMAGGTILQCLVPVIGWFMFLRQRDFFGISFAFGWMGTNCFDVAVYVADARSLNLPLYSISGGDSIHDWNYLLGEFGLLQWDDRIAMFLRATGYLMFGVCLVFGGWILWRMMRKD
jgi:hypothetical protein